MWIKRNEQDSSIVRKRGLSAAVRIQRSLEDFTDVPQQQKTAVPGPPWREHGLNRVVFKDSWSSEANFYGHQPDTRERHRV